ncbi:MAG: 2-succinyl-5-enolpyruvyl-6-hydroxy-3-cyclohexene-1-carboxylate synthase [Myxococcota bacterium]
MNPRTPAADGLPRPKVIHSTVGTRRSDVDFDVDPLESDADRSVAQANLDLAMTIVRSLVNSGVRRAVVSPGSRSTPLALALTGEASIVTDVVVDERAAAFVALGITRVTHRPVALLATSGSAGAHWLPALAEASASRLPLIAITANRPAELQRCGAPQTIDQAGMLAPFVVSTATFAALLPGQSLRPTQRELLALCSALPRGPVHVDVAFRKPLWLAGLEPSVSKPIERIEESATAPRSAVDRLHAVSNQRGVFVLGPNDFAATDLQSLVNCACALGWPILADIASGVRGIDSPAVVAHPEIAVRASSTVAPEVVVAIGRWPTSRAVTNWLGDAPMILVDPHGDWHDPTHRAETLLAVPVGALFDAVRTRATQSNTAWLERWVALDAAAEAGLNTLVQRTPNNWSEAEVIREIHRALPAGTHLHLASSMPIRDAEVFAGRQVGVTITSNRGANGIDGTIATAAGIASTGRPTVVICGDVAALHDVGGLVAASELSRPLTVVILDNRGGNIFRKLPVKDHARFRKLFLTPPASDLRTLAGAVADRTTTAQSLAAARDAVTASLRQPGLSVLVLSFDPDTNNRRRADLLAEVVAHTAASIQ